MPFLFLYIFDNKLKFIDYMNIFKLIILEINIKSSLRFIKVI
jgi:hypothetical protein